MCGGVGDHSSSYHVPHLKINQKGRGDIDHHVSPNQPVNKLKDINQQECLNGFSLFGCTATTPQILIYAPSGSLTFDPNRQLSRMVLYWADHFD